MRDVFGSPLLVATSAVYFSQGFRAFSELGTQFFLKDDLGLEPAVAQLVLTTAHLPWNVKPLYGMVSDNFALCGTKRQSYLIVATILGAGSLFGMAWLAQTAAIASVFLFTNNLSVAVSDVVMDAKVVEEARKEPEDGAGNLQSFSWTVLSAGGLIGSAAAGVAIVTIGPRAMFYVMAAVTALVVLAVRFLEETPVTDEPVGCGPCCKQLGAVLQTLRNPLIFRPTLWIFLSTACSPSFYTFMFYFYTDELHIEPTFIATLNVVGYAALIVGNVLYNAYLKKVSFRVIFFWAQLAHALMSLLDLVLVMRANVAVGMDDHVFLVSSEVIGDVLGRFKQMPQLVLCAKLCPERMEATLFALLMSVNNLSYDVSKYFGVACASALNVTKSDMSNLPVLVVIRSVGLFVPILFLCLIPATDPTEEIRKLDSQMNAGAGATRLDEEDDSEDGGGGSGAERSVGARGVEMQQIGVALDEPEAGPEQEAALLSR